jgi:uroporphyrinogen decarboxylase
MRQAGRYLPEYRLLRSRHDFAELCKTPELACEASLQPWQRFKMDAVIVFSDILFVPEAMGLRLKFKKEGGPVLSPELISPDDLASLKEPDIKKDLNFVFETIKLLKQKLPSDVPVIGFSGAPWTLAYYMTRDNAYEWIKKYSKDLKGLLLTLCSAVTEYVRLQQDAGADVIQLFDTWAGELSKDEFDRFELPYLKKIVSDGRKKAPFIVYSRKCRHILASLAATGADVVSIDPKTPIEEAMQCIGNTCAIQGNLDPKILTTTPGMVRQETSRLLSKTRGFNGFIANLGHGALPTTLVECVEAFVEIIKLQSIR